jgi:hypothetical protein
MSFPIKINYINFLHVLDNRINVYIDSITGHGYIIKPENQIFTGTILNPTGLQPAVFYKTGVLNAFISSGSGSFTWSNLEIVGIGEVGSVYLNYATGYKNASNIIEFIDNTGFGLQEGDLININNTSFTYRNEPQTPIEFNSPERFINILNSGATGAFNDLGFDFLENSIGITGYQDNNKLFLFSDLRLGEDGNNILIYKTASNFDAIKIYNRYFTGGITFRPPLLNWVGTFSNTFNLVVENSGFYKQRVNREVFSSISGVKWEDNFSGNYIILTGLTNPSNFFAYSGQRLLFNPVLGQYSGSATIPKNLTTIYTGFNIEINKPNPYNISGNKFEYIISGDDFIF